MQNLVLLASPTLPHLPISLLNEVDEVKVNVNHLSLGIMFGFGVEKFGLVRKIVLQKIFENHHY